MPLGGLLRLLGKFGCCWSGMMQSQSGHVHSPLPCSGSPDQTDQEREQPTTRRVKRRRGRKGKFPKPTCIKVKPFHSPRPDSIQSGSFHSSVLRCEDIAGRDGNELHQRRGYKLDCNDTVTRRERVSSAPVNERTVTRRERVSSTPVDGRTVTRRERVSSTPVSGRTVTRRERVSSAPVNGRTVTGQWNGDQPTLSSHRSTVVNSANQDLEILPWTPCTRFRSGWAIGESYRSIVVTKQKQKTEGAQCGKSPQRARDNNTTHTSNQAALEDDRLPDGVTLVKKANPSSTFTTLSPPTPRSFRRTQASSSMNSLPASDKVPKPLWKRVVKSKGVAYELVFPSQEPLQIVKMKKKTMSMRMEKAEQRIKKTLQEMKAKRLAKQEERRIGHTVQAQDAKSDDLVKSLEACNLGIIGRTKGGLSYEIPSWWDLEEEEELKEVPANSEALPRVDPEVADYYQRMDRWMMKRRQCIKSGFDVSKDVPPYKPPPPPPRVYYKK